MSVSFFFFFSKPAFSARCRKDYFGKINFFDENIDFILLRGKSDNVEFELQPVKVLGEEGKR